MAGEPDDDPEDLLPDDATPDPQDDQADDQDDQQQDDQQDEQDEEGEQQVDETAAAQQDDRSRSPQQQERQPSRRDRRLDTLLQERQRNEQELADLRRRLDALTQRPTESPGETEAQRAARHATMTPMEIMQETLAAAEQRHTAQLQHLQMSVMDQTDRSAYEAKATSDPLYSRWMPKVEARLAEMRNHPDPRQRANAPREVILKFLLGEAMLAKRGSKEAKQERMRGQQRVQRQRTRPANGAGDVQPQRGRQQNLERRLENMSL